MPNKKKKTAEFQERHNVVSGLNKRNKEQLLELNRVERVWGT
jgi:hypothetical protein